MFAFLGRRGCRFALIFFGAVAAVSIAFVGITTPVDSYAACLEAGYPVVSNDPPVCRAENHNFTGTPDPEPSLAPTVTTIPYETLVNGDTHNPVPAHHQQFISTQSEWQAYWRSVHGGLSTLPPIIPVDFSKYSVVAASLGAQPTTGFGIKITSVSAGADGNTVSVTESTPTITCQVAQTPTNRYLIVRTEKIAGTVTFRVTTEKRHCS